MALKAFRKFGDSKVAKAMLLLLVVCFGAWGIGDYLVKQVGNDAVSVNGEGLSAAEVERLYQGRVEQVQKLMGGRVAPETLAQLNIPATVLQEAISRAVLRQEASVLKLYPATDAVRDEIVHSSDFVVNGKFDAARYQDTVARVGMTTAAFEKSVAQDLSVRLLGQLARVAKPAPAVVANLAALEGATTRLNVVKLSPALLPAEKPLDDAALGAFLHDNQQVFTLPEMRTLVVLSIDPNTVAKTLTLDPEEVRAAYDANPAAFAEPEKRRVRHLLVETKAEAEAAAAEIKTLEDLARVAREKSLDDGTKPLGGDLGLITQDEVVPSFGETAFKLGAGEVSAPVESAFGWHIIGVEAIEPAKTVAFEDVKERIENDLKAQEAEQAVFDLQNTADDRIASGEKLETIGKDLGLEARRLTKVTAEAPGGASAAVLNAGFATEAGEVSPPVELEGGGVAYVGVEEVIPASVPLLADIKDNVRAMAEAARRQTALKDLGDKALAAGKDSGADWSAKVTAAAGGEASSLTVASLQDVPDWLEPGWVQVNGLAAGQALPTVLADGANRYVVQVASRTLAQPDAKALDTAAGATRQRWQQDYETLLIAQLMREAHVETNETRLRQIFGMQQAQ